VRKLQKNENVNDLGSVILAKIGDTLLERLGSELKNKESGVYPVVLSDPLAIREEGIERLNNKGCPAQPWKNIIQESNFLNKNVVSK